VSNSLLATVIRSMVAEGTRFQTRRRNGHVIEWKVLRQGAEPDEGWLEAPGTSSRQHLEKRQGRPNQGRKARRRNGRSTGRSGG
jgi:hypothetical protein